MATTQTTRGRSQDRAKVAGGQDHEVKYEAGKTGASKADVKSAVKSVGNSRKKVEDKLSKKKATAAGQMVRIATFNVNGVNGRLPVLIRWLTATNYDIVCLQELKTSDEKFPADAIREAGYGAIWHGQKSYNGVAILSRGVDPVERRRGLLGDADDTIGYRALA
ncbi:MAG: DUF3606 domain-containing protein [Mesorhizobium sp.]|nr:MAG: DUF3606 domain-containing protein [Mesorhizobium sp.]